MDTKVPRDGTVHELTSNVMIFLVNLLSYVDILSRVITTGAGPNSELLNQRSKDRNKLVYAEYIIRVLSALGLTLKNKGEVYNDPFLRAIFMLNNFHYILKVNICRLPNHSLDVSFNPLEPTVILLIKLLT